MPPADVSELTPGLLRWTAPHPDWTSASDWERMVGSVLYEDGEIVVLIDPLLPSEGREQFLAWLDGLIGARAVSILTTIHWHSRDRAALAERYAANTPGAWNAVPPGVSPRPLRGAGETPYWLPGAASVVFGDRVIGAPGGGLALCPESWLADVRVDRRGLAGLMRGLVELPIERVLVSHGEPVLQGGRAALAHAIREAGG